MMCSLWVPEFSLLDIVFKLRPLYLKAFIEGILGLLCHFFLKKELFPPKIRSFACTRRKFSAMI